MTAWGRAPSLSLPSATERREGVEWVQSSEVRRLLTPSPNLWLPLPLIAFVVAKKNHAPNATGFFENGVIRSTPASELIYTMADPPNILGATQCLDMLGVMGLLQSGRVHLGFLGAAEVDRFGNLNSTQVDGAGSRVRLPGSGGACDIASLAQRFVVLLEHSKQRLPERVSYITSPGNGNGGDWRRHAGLPRGGPSAVITTKAVLRFSDDG